MASSENIFRSIVGFTIMILTIIVVLFSGASSITRQNVEAHLQQFADTIAKDAAESGREGKLSYGDVAIEGWGYQKHAIVPNVILDISEKNLLDTNRWSLSTGQMVVLPDPTQPNRLIFEFPEPINVIENSQLKTIVNFSAPLKYGYYEGTEKQQPVILHSLHLPDQITLASVSAAGETPDSLTHNMVIQYDPNPVFTIKSLPQTHEREVNYDFQNIKVDSGEGTKLLIAYLSSKQHEMEGNDNQIKGKYTLTVSDLIINDKNSSGVPYTLAVDVDYTTDKAGVNAQVPMPDFGHAEVAINTMTLSTIDFALKATGKFANSANDPLPSGSVNVEIDNAKKFVESDLVPPYVRTAMADALHKASGQPVDAPDPLNIVLKRDKNGVFYVGNMTFEQLTASLVANMVHSAKGPPPPAPGKAMPPKEASPSAAPDASKIPVPPDASKIPATESPPAEKTSM